MSEGDTIPLRGSADMWRSRAKAAEAMVATAHPPKMIRDLVGKLQAAEAENARLHAEVARLTQQLDDLGHRYAGVESSLHGANARIAELEALAAENDAAYRIWRRRCEAAESRIAELEAELLGAMREKEDVRRTATEAALRWAWNEYINSNFVIDPNGFIERGLLDLLVEK